MAGRQILADSEGFEVGKNGVSRLLASGSGGVPGELVCWIARSLRRCRRGVDVGRCDAFVSERESNDGLVDAAGE